MLISHYYPHDKSSSPPIPDLTLAAVTDPVGKAVLGEATAAMLLVV